MPDQPSTSAAALPAFNENGQLLGTYDSFLERNQKSLIALALVIVLGAGGYGIVRSIQANGEKSGGEALSNASSTTALAAVVKNHSGTPAAGSAQILLADSQWIEGKKDEAIGTLQKFIADQPEHPLIPTAQANLATKLAATGKTAEATELFEKIAGNSAAAYIAPYALISLGDLAKSANQLDKAKESYQRAQNDFPNSPFSQTASSRLQILNAKPPVEIDAPPAAPAAKDSDVPAANLLAPGGLSPQIPFGTPTIPADGGANAPGNP